MHERSTEVVLDDLIFGEAPRWHDGRLWFSDFFAHVVRTLAPDGSTEQIVEVPQQPSGLGWLPDGRLLVVSMIDRKVLRLDPDGLVEHADLSGVAAFHANDMVVDTEGRAYVGNFGSDIGRGEPLRTALLALVHPDGQVEVATDNLAFPNGMAITPDASTLLVAESFAARISAYERTADGRLGRRRIWAELPDRHPDGICLDIDGGLWVADPPRYECVRVTEGGTVTDRVRTTRPCIACALGGPDGRTLFLTTTWFSDVANRRGDEMGAVEAVEVDSRGVDHAQ